MIDSSHKSRNYKLQTDDKEELLEYIDYLVLLRFPIKFPLNVNLDNFYFPGQADQRDDD